MNSKQLHYFLTTAKTGSIAATARELDIAQPAISQQLANLERELGAPLFLRSFKGVLLTPAGEVFKKHANDLVCTIDQAKSEIAATVGRTSGKIRVGMLESIGNVLSMQMLSEIQNNYPELELDLSSGPSFSIKSWLQKGKIDIALTYELDKVSENIRYIPLIEEIMHLAVGKNTELYVKNNLAERDHIAFWELCDYTLLTPGLNTSLGQLIQRYEKLTGIELHHNRAYSGQLMTGLRQVMQGAGVMILPSSALYHLEENGLIHSLKIVDPIMTRKVVAAVNIKHTPSAISTSVISLISTIVRTEHALGHWRGDLLV